MMDMSDIYPSREKIVRENSPNKKLCKFFRNGCLFDLYYSLVIGATWISGGLMHAFKPKIITRVNLSKIRGDVKNVDIFSKFLDPKFAEALGLWQIPMGIAEMTVAGLGLYAVYKNKPKLLVPHVAWNVVAGFFTVTFICLYYYEPGGTNNFDIIRDFTLFAFGNIFNVIMLKQHSDMEREKNKSHPTIKKRDHWNLFHRIFNRRSRIHNSNHHFVLGHEHPRDIDNNNERDFHNFTLQQFLGMQNKGRQKDEERY